MNGDLHRPTLWIDPRAIAQNIAIARSRSAAEVIAVVKANGYGLGTLTLARAALGGGATQLGTTDLGEAVTLREAGVRAPILTWLNASGVDAAAAAEHQIAVAIGSLEELNALLIQHSVAPVTVHLHLDVGMCREGASPLDWPALFESAARAQRQNKIRIGGLMGHLAQADRAEPELNDQAVQAMLAAKARASVLGLGRLKLHLAATAATLTDPSTHFDMVRFGAGLAGIDPSGRTDLAAAARLTAPVVHSVWASEGTSVGYGGMYRSTHDGYLSVLPLGYADGIPREISTDASVQIAGRRHRVVGRVSMDQIIIDTGPHRYARGTRATIFGAAASGAPTLAEWASWAQSIAHTIICTIGPRVIRSVQ
ncbi:alanine racemase [Glutamicibacter endophyticus]